MSERSPCDLVRDCGGLSANAGLMPARAMAARAVSPPWPPTGGRPVRPAGRALGRKSRRERRHPNHRRLGAPLCHAQAQVSAAEHGAVLECGRLTSHAGVAFGSQTSSHLHGHRSYEHDLRGERRSIDVPAAPSRRQLRRGGSSPARPPSSTVPARALRTAALMHRWRSTVIDLRTLPLESGTVPATRGAVIRSPTRARARPRHDACEPRSSSSTSNTARSRRALVASATPCSTA